MGGQGTGNDAAGSGKGEISYGRGVTLVRDRLQIAFTLDGQQRRELLPLQKITQRAVEVAQSIRAEIVRKIAAGSFEYGEFFPESKHLAREAKAEAVAAKSTTMGDLLRCQLEMYRTRFANGSAEKSTVTGYGKLIRSGWYERWDAVQVGDVTPEALRSWIKEMGAAGVTAKTCRNKLTPMRSALEDAASDGLIGSDPFDQVDLKKLLKQVSAPKTYEISPLTRAEIESMCAVATSAEASLLRFWAATGLRPSELIALTWGQVDLVAKRMRIDRARVEGEEKGTKTPSGVRWVDLSPVAVEALKDQATRSRLAGDVVWLNTGRSWGNGRPWTTDGRLRDTFWNPLVERSGVTHRAMYQCRHTFASQLLTAGVNPFYVQNQLGHADATMLFRVYGRFIPQDYFTGTRLEDSAAVGGSKPPRAKSR
jgi:integrase